MTELFTIFKSLLPVCILLFTLPTLAADTDTASRGFINDYEDIIKNIVTLFGVIMTVVGAILVAKISRKAPDALVKLEQLKLIDVLVYNKAHQNPDNYLVVEEAFKLYYNTYIPIEIIKLLSNLEERFFAFASYAKVGGLISFNKKTGKIKSLSGLGKFLRIVALFVLSTLFAHICFGFLVAASFMTAKSNMLDIIWGGVFAIPAVFCAYAMFIIFSRMIDLKSDFTRFESKLEGKVETTEINKSDLLIIIICIGIIIGLWLIRHFLSK